MSYFDGTSIANIRVDAMSQAKCDPKKGWKREGSKCVRTEKKKAFRKGVATGVGGTLGAQLALNLAGGAVLAHQLNKMEKAERARAGL